MNRLRWWAGAAVATVVLAVVAVYALGIPRRSAFVAREAPKACDLVTRDSPLGAVNGCTPLGRRTPPLGDPEGTVFLLLETERGPAAVRIDYSDTGRRPFTARAVEIPTWEAPGISHDTAERLKEAVNQRGGLQTRPWTVSGGA
ncbi:hypothetical protein GCM10010399_89910 [Dactylosporangium fulvum]|uniref:Secreted protein n=1 Tax=Dactylosporangium fulvum TaxID=53359 RepID=A0ABY5VP03_9ACTN|nr:hypothetical protein [Dactylosporangium fulvum]UWP79472.1 hypothetical protein Dfulv_30430 [Dactylosporangium fulvum]